MKRRSFPELLGVPTILVFGLTAAMGVLIVTADWRAARSVLVVALILIVMRLILLGTMAAFFSIVSGPFVLLALGVHRWLTSKRIKREAWESTRFPHEPS